MADREIDALVDRVVAAAGIADDRERESLRRELYAHFEDAVSSPQQRQDAITRFGSLDWVGESLRRAHQQRRGVAMWRDLKFAARMVRRGPGFALLAVACLTLGIGSNAAVFSWIEGTLLRPYPLVAGQDRMLAVTATHRGTGARDAMSWPDFMDLARSSTLGDAFFAEKITGAAFGLGERSEWITGSMVSWNYFDAIGVRPVLGRGFAPGDDVGRAAHPLAVISYDMWQRRFGGRADVIDQKILLNAVPYTVIGVAPQGFYGTFVGYPFEFWVPASMQVTFDAGVYKLEDRHERWVEGYMRTRPGVTFAQAQAEASAIMSRLETLYPTTNRGVGITLYPLWQTPFNGSASLRPTLEIALVVVIAVLLIACANVGNLLLVRAVARQQEMTIRLSLGAARVQLVRQLLIEGVLLAATATAAGLGVAHLLRDGLVYLTPNRGVPLYMPGAIDWRVVAFSAGLCLVATLLFALAPAVLTSNIDIAGALRSGAAPVLGGRRRGWLRSGLVLVQMALSFVLIVTTGLLLESLQRMRHAEPGFAADDVVVSSGVNLANSGFDVARARVFEDAVLDRLRATPGVESVAFARTTPFTYRPFPSAQIAVPGYVVQPGEQPMADFNQVGPDFLSTLGIPILRGRGFRRSDDATGAPVAVVDETMAARFWRGADPVDSMMNVDGKAYRVIGIARATKKDSLQEAPQPFFYVSRLQSPSLTMALFMRTRLAPAALRPVVSQAIHDLAPDAPASLLTTLRQNIDLMSWSQRVGVQMLSVFGAIALLLAAVGLYGVMASSVAQGTRELALRMALGARPPDVLRLVLSKGLLLTTVGVAVGIGAALELTRLLGTMLYGVSPRDPMSFTIAATVIVVASLIACVIPAWKATRTDPLTALRS